MPKKYEHVLKCKLSKRQRLLYDEFMSLGSTRETLAEGRYMSVINILMQLRKVCNHPDLFDPRPTLSPFVAEPLDYCVPSLVFNLADSFAEQRRNLFHFQPSLPDMELSLSAFACHRAKRLQTPRKLIEQLFAGSLTSALEAESAADSDSTSSYSSSLDLDRFFLNSTLEGLELCTANADFQAKLRKLLAHSQISIDLRDLQAHHYRNLIQYVARLNRQKCAFVKPVYGLDLRACVSEREMTSSRPTTATDKRVVDLTSLDYAAQSYATCLNIVNYENDKHRPSVFWSQTRALAELVNWTRRNLFEPGVNTSMLDVLTRFVVYVPRVWYASKHSLDPYESEPIKLRVAQPSPSFYARSTVLIEDITESLRPSSVLVQHDALMSQQFYYLNRFVDDFLFFSFYLFMGHYFDLSKNYDSAH